MLRKALSVFLAATMFVLAGLQAQNTVPVKTIDKMTPEEAGNYYKTYHSRTPFTKEQKELLKKNIPSKAAPQTKSTKAPKMPDKFWFPGEFEEVQSIVITWVYATYDKYPSPTKYIQPVNDSLGYYWVTSNTVAISPYVSVIDTSNSSRMPIIFAEVANAVQKGNAQVWINLYNIEDSNIVKRYMSNHGMPLTNYRFFGFQGNSFWYRDCGPVAFYYGDNDDVAFLDFEYYGGRAMDDLLPIKLGEELNIPVYTSTIEYEGGNILVDGAGTLFTSSHIDTANLDSYGQYFIQNNKLYQTEKRALTKKQIRDSITYLMGLSRLEVLPALQYDGGTGHIDLYAAFWDENNLVYTQYPDTLKKNPDFGISTSNVDSILSLKTYSQKTYRGKNIPLPKRDNNTWYTSASDFQRYTRTYSNSTFVNNVIIQPVFSNDTWGAREWDLKAIEIMKKQFPGYEIIPIDIRGYQSDLNLSTGFDGTGGAIHCITKQIPAENPIRILHGAIQGMATSYNGSFPIEATITNKSGIASVDCYWRKKGTPSFTKLSMENKGNDKYSATITSSASVAQDTIEYYISATSNNGKTITKPMTAPNGCYSFYFGTAVTQETPDVFYTAKDTLVIPTVGENTLNVSDDVAISNFYPNPAKDLAQLQITHSAQISMNVAVINAFGQIIYQNSFTPASDQVIFQLKTSSFATGMYNVVFTDKKGNTMTRKLLIER